MAYKQKTIQAVVKEHEAKALNDLAKLRGTSASGLARQFITKGLMEASPEMQTQQEAINAIAKKLDMSTDKATDLVSTVLKLAAVLEGRA